MHQGSLELSACQVVLCTVASEDELCCRYTDLMQHVLDDVAKAAAKAASSGMDSAVFVDDDGRPFVPPGGAVSKATIPVEDGPILEYIVQVLSNVLRKIGNCKTKDSAAWVSGGEQCRPSYDGQVSSADYSHCSGPQHVHHFTGGSCS